MSPRVTEPAQRVRETRGRADSRGTSVNTRSGPPRTQGSPAKPGSALGYRLVRPKAGERSAITQARAKPRDLTATHAARRADECCHE